MREGGGREGGREGTRWYDQRSGAHIFIYTCGIMSKNRHLLIFSIQFISDSRHRGSPGRVTK